MTNVAIYGAGGFGKEVRGLVEDMTKAGVDISFAGYIDDFKTPDSLAREGAFHDVIIAIANTAARKSVASRLRDQYPFKAVVHPDVTVRRGVQVGNGSIICSGVKLTVDITLGSFVIINLNATVGHDVVLGDFASIMPGVNLSGSVKVGAGAFIGSGATILQGLSIGDNAVVGAGAVVTRDVPAGSRVAVFLQDRSTEEMVNRTIILFIVKFIGLYLLLNTIYGFWYESFNPVADPLTRIVTDQSARVISWVEPGVTAEPYPRGPEVSVKQGEKIVINVFEGCNGVNVMIVFLSFVVAFSGTWKSTIVFSAAGIGVIYVANLGRVITLFFIAKYYPQSLYIFHKYLFTGGLYLFVFVLWYLWIEKFRRQRHV